MLRSELSIILYGGIIMKKFETIRKSIAKAIIALKARGTTRNKMSKASQVRRYILKAHNL